MVVPFFAMREGQKEVTVADGGNTMVDEDDSEAELGDGDGDSAFDREVEIMSEIVMGGITMPGDVSAGDGGGVELSTVCWVLPTGTFGEFVESEGEVEGTTVPDELDGMLRLDNSGMEEEMDEVSVGRVVAMYSPVFTVLGKTLDTVSPTGSVIPLTTPFCRACNCWCLRWVILRLTGSIRILPMVWGAAPNPKLPPPRSTPFLSKSSSSSVPVFLLVPPAFTPWWLSDFPDFSISKATQHTRK